MACEMYRRPKRIFVQRFLELVGIDIFTSVTIYAGAHRVQRHWLGGPVCQRNQTGSQVHSLNTPQHFETRHVAHAHFKQ